MGAKPCVRMLLGGAGFSGLGVAFMFPADAQPEREVPHTHGGSPRHPLSSLPGGRAPPEVFRENRLTRESPRAFRRGGFSLESFAKNGGVAVKRCPKTAFRHFSNKA